jgi:hypothetical protein
MGFSPLAWNKGFADSWIETSWNAPFYKAWPVWTYENQRWMIVLGGYEGAIDTTLIPLGTQYGATPGNPEQRMPPRYAGFATSCKPLQRLSDHS